MNEVYIRHVYRYPVLGVPAVLRDVSIEDFPPRRACRILSLVNAGRDPWRLYPRTAEVLAEVEALPAADRRRVLAYGDPRA